MQIFDRFVMNDVNQIWTHWLYILKDHRIHFVYKEPQVPAFEWLFLNNLVVSCTTWICHLNILKGTIH